MDIQQSEKPQKDILQPIYKHLSVISNKIEDESPVLIFIHWDAIMQYYTGRKIKKKLRSQLIKTLHKLNKPPKLYVSVISSLRLSDIENELGLGELIYCGNFGMEIESRSFGWSITGAKQLKKQLEALDEKIKYDNPFRIEMDVSNLGLIYQIKWENTAVPAADVKRTLIQLFDSSDQFKILARYQELDVLPNIPWNLGTCVEKVTSILNLSRDDYSRLYFGCVKNDERVFQILNRPEDFGVWVGEKPIFRTSVAYHLKDHKELIHFLQWIYSKQ